MSHIDGFVQSPSKRRRLSPPTGDFQDQNQLPQLCLLKSPDNPPERNAGSTEQSKAEENGNITLSATSKLAGQTVAPFLAKHIPAQYAHMGAIDSSGSPKSNDSNTRYCYRHRPDLKCRRQANEPSMEQLQHVSPEAYISYIKELTVPLGAGSSVSS